MDIINRWEVFNPVENEIHASDRSCHVDQLLPIEAERSPISAPALQLCERRDEHAAGPAGGVVNPLASLGFEHLRHQVHQGAVGVKLLRGVAAVVGELLDEVLVGVAQFVLGDRGEAERVLGEMFDQVLERLVRHLRLVGPRGVAEDTVEAARIGHLDGPEGVEEGTTDVAGGGPHIRPMRAVRDMESVVGGGSGVSLIAGLVEGCVLVLVPDVRQPLEE